MIEAHAYACQCGAVSVALRGRLIVRAVCYCDDCQAASQRVAELLDGTAIAGPDGGTDYVLWRKDRLTVDGADKLWRFKLRDGSITNRAIAGCCGTPMFIDFDGGPHWVSLLADRFASAPGPVDLAINVRFAPNPDAVPAPKHDKVPLSMIAKLIGARIAMTFGR